MSDAAKLSPFQRTPLDVLLGRWTLDYSPAFIVMDLMSRLFSPYELNPIDSNPLRDILAHCVDFGRLARAPIKLFVTATNVHTGRGHVFRNNTITPDVLLASACLPTLFQGIQIDGEPYWDGGYSGNPTITRSRGNAPRRTPSSSRSIRSSGTERRGPRATFSIAPTKCPSTACC